MRRISLCALACAAIGASASCAEELFVAVGQDGRRASSLDGVHWQHETRWRGGGALLNVAVGGGRFVAVGGGAEFGRIVASADGREWHEVFESAECVATIALVQTASGDSRFVAASGGGLLHSTDGGRFKTGQKLDWSAKIHPHRSAFGDTEAGRMCLIIGDAEFAGGTERVSWRAATGDGVTFLHAKQRTAPASDIAHGAGRFVVAGPRGLIESSHDGQTWKRHDLPVREDFARVIWTGSRFIASGEKSAWTSEDGVAWTAESRRIPAPVAWGSEHDGASQFFALSSGGTVHRATNPLIWEKLRLTPGPPFEAIARRTR